MTFIGVFVELEPLSFNSIVARFVAAFVVVAVVVTFVQRASLVEMSLYAPKYHELLLQKYYSIGNIVHKTKYRSMLLLK